MNQSTDTKDIDSGNLKMNLTEGTQGDKEKVHTAFNT